VVANRWGLNQAADQLCQLAIAQADRLGVQTDRLSTGACLIDFGVQAPGSLAAGLLLARICMGAAAEVTLHPPSSESLGHPQVYVQTDLPALACMGAQYAGWPVQVGKYFAMGSGPMRALRGREPVLVQCELTESADCAIGVLEAEKLPDTDVFRAVADDCQLEPSQITLCVAPSYSIAGNLQVVARSVETALHKLFEIGVDPRSVVSAVGSAPLPPPAHDFISGIGRTNDAILYGGQVTLWLRGDDDQLADLARRVPSSASPDAGQPFVELFKACGYDFYKVDPGLFAPAVVTLVNLASGRSFRGGQLRLDLIRQSFATVDQG